MTREQAEYIMCTLGLEEFPSMSPRSYDRCKRLCEAFTVMTGCKATPREVRTSYTGGTLYVPELERGI